MKNCDYDKKLRELIFTALGEASMCWDETPKGVFDASHAKEIGEKLYTEILFMRLDEWVEVATTP
jgi:hypothetical protein